MRRAHSSRTLLPPAHPGPLTMPSPIPHPKQRHPPRWRQPMLGVGLVALAGVVCLWTRLGAGLDNFSFDTAFVLTARPAPTNVVLIKMDEQAQRELNQP